MSEKQFHILNWSGLSHESAEIAEFKYVSQVWDITI